MGLLPRRRRGVVLQHLPRAGRLPGVAVRVPRRRGRRGAGAHGRRPTAARPTPTCTSASAASTAATPPRSTSSTRSGSTTCPARRSGSRWPGWRPVGPRCRLRPPGQDRLRRERTAYAGGGRSATSTPTRSSTPPPASAALGRWSRSSQAEAIATTGASSTHGTTALEGHAREQAVEDAVADQRGESGGVERRDGRPARRSRSAPRSPPPGRRHQRQREQRAPARRRPTTRSATVRPAPAPHGRRRCRSPTTARRAGTARARRRHVAAAAERRRRPGRRPRAAPRPPARRRDLAQHPGGDHDREDDLRLEHQGGEPRRHAGRHGDVQEAELAQRHEGPDREDAAPRRVGRRDEEDRRERRRR